MAGERLDFIVFGATGFTGKYTVKEVARFANERRLKFGVAGRRKDALRAVLKEFAPDNEDVPIIIADVNDEESLKKMTEQAKVILNCCGPYRFYGEPVIKACIATRTHHLDVSGEPQYMEEMQLEYNKAAKEAGIYIVSACGFDSVPCDLGVLFTQKKFQGELNSIETYLQVLGTVQGPALNYGTWESAVNVLAHADELRPLRTKLFPEKLPPLLPKLKTRGIIHRSSVSEGWSTVFPGTDRSVASRTQRFLYEKYKQRPVQIQTYLTFKSMFNLLATAIVGLVFVLFTKCQYGRDLLLKYPKFFSFGIVTRDGPPEEVIKSTSFSIVFHAKGWTEKLAEPTDKHSEPPNKVFVTKVSSAIGGYEATCIALVLCGIKILEESDKMPDNGGVFSPGAAFGNTSLIEELDKNGIKFEVLSSTER